MEWQSFHCAAEPRFDHCKGPDHCDVDRAAHRRAPSLSFLGVRQDENGVREKLAIPHGHLAEGLGVSVSRRLLPVYLNTRVVSYEADDEFLNEGHHVWVVGVDSPSDQVPAHRLVEDFLCHAQVWPILALPNVGIGRGPRSCCHDIRDPAFVILSQRWGLGGCHRQIAWGLRGCPPQ